MNEYAEFQVAVKGLLTRDDGRLLVLSRPDGYVDFPGGRVDKAEMAMPFEQVLQREIIEEIGPAVQYEQGNIGFVAKRDYTITETTYHLTVLFYKLQYISGEIQLSDEHEIYEWISPQDLVADMTRQYVSEDERLQLAKYFS